MIQNYINHIALVVDKSGSMSHLSATVVQVFDKEINYLKRRSQELKQETRISIYLFDDVVECLVFDMDVMRMESLAGHYRIGGSTALRAATYKAIEDMGKLPELYGDHAFLVYVLTDGEENASYHVSTEKLVAKFKSLADHWTVVAMVPDARGIAEAKKFGFPASNVSVWSTSTAGVEQVGREFRSAMDSYMVNRAAGVRGTKSFFHTDLSTVSVGEVKANLQELKDYQIFGVTSTFGASIKDFVEQSTGKPYRTGSAYYELVKREDIQGYKSICIQHNVTKKVYSGTAARQILKLPDYELKVSPGDHGEWTIFVQSTSVNRKLLMGNRLLVIGAVHA